MVEAGLGQEDLRRQQVESRQPLTQEEAERWKRLQANEEKVYLEEEAWKLREQAAREQEEEQSGKRKQPARYEKVLGNAKRTRCQEFLRTSRPVGDPSLGN